MYGEGKVIMGAGVLGRRRRVAVPESDWTGGVTS